MAGADPYAAVRARLEGLPAGRRTFVVGGGKAAVAMARAAEDALGERLAGGAVVAPEGPPGVPKPRLIRLLRGGHPLPTEEGVRGAEAILSLLRGLEAGDRVIGLISGGASALLTAPVEGCDLATVRATSQALLRSGRPIDEINTERGRLSLTAQGGLARAAGEASVLALVASDVVGDDLSVIGGAPFLGAECEIVVSNADALRAAARAAEALGYATDVVTRTLQGEARQVGREIAERLLAEPAGGPRCLLWGGETTVTVRGDGLGGRNQELALAAAEVLSGSTGICLLAGGTDGADGPTAAAGAVVDGATAGRTDIRAALAANASHPACVEAEAVLTTGPTGVNAMDVVVGLRS